MDFNYVKQLYRKRLWVWVPLIICLNISEVNAQSIKPVVFTSANSSANSTSTSLIWTVGETVVSTLESPGVKLYQGFIMPITVSGPPLAAPSKSGFDLVDNAFSVEQEMVLVYPNPLSQGEVLHIRGDSLTPRSVSLRVITANGQLLDPGSVNAEFDAVRNELSLQLKVPSGLYLLQVPMKGGSVTKKLIIR